MNLIKLFCGKATKGWHNFCFALCYVYHVKLIISYCWANYVFFIFSSKSYHCFMVKRATLFTSRFFLQLEPAENWKNNPCWNCKKSLKRSHASKQIHPVIWWHWYSITSFKTGFSGTNLVWFWFCYTGIPILGTSILGTQIKKEESTYKEKWNQV